MKTSQLMILRCCRVINCQNARRLEEHLVYAFVFDCLSTSKITMINLCNNINNQFLLIIYINLWEFWIFSIVSIVKQKFQRKWIIVIPIQFFCIFYHVVIIVDLSVLYVTSEYRQFSSTFIFNSNCIWVSILKLIPSYLLFLADSLYGQ